MADLASRYEAYVDARVGALLACRTGRGDAAELARVDERFEDVTSGDALEGLARELEGARFQGQRDDLSRLKHAVEDAVVESRVRELALRLRERELGQRLRVGKRDAGAREWSAHLAEEPDAARRTDIQLALDGAWAELCPLREELLVARVEAFARLGYANARAWAEARRPGVRYDSWGTAAAHLLDRTEAAYRDAARPALQALGVTPETAHRGDAVRLGRLVAYDALFPAARLVDALHFTVDGMAVDLDRLPLSIDLAERPGKSADAFCVSLRDPDRVVLVALPRAGVPMCADFLHAAGRALGHLFASPSLAAQWRSAPDDALAQAWGTLLAARLSDREWIASGPAAGRAEAFARDIGLRRLAELRRCAAQVRFELELARLEPGSDPRALSGRYATELSQATGVRFGPEGSLAGAERVLASVDRLRAACLEVQLSDLLRERFGRRFWRERGAGELLKELWNTGATYSAEQIADELGLGALDVDRLIEGCLGRGW